MRTATLPSTMSAVEDSGFVHIALQVRRCGEPISGLLSAGDRHERTFIGLLELIALIDQARTDPGGGERSSKPGPCG